MLYDYEAKNNKGEHVRGTLDASSESAAAAQMREHGLFVLSLRLKPGAAEGILSGTAPRSQESLLARVFPPVSLKQRMQFWAQLQSVLDSGMTMSEGLGTIASTGSGHLKRIAEAASRKTATGDPLSAVLGDYPASFPRAEVALMRAGEHAGTTPQVIATLAEMNEAELKTRRDFMFQLAYPAFVLLAVAFIPLLPTLVLDGPAAALDVIRTRYLPYAVLVIALFLGARFLLALLPPFKLAWDHVKLRVPGIGGMVTKMSAARAADVIAAGYRSGLDIALALELAGDSCGNESMGRRIRAAAPGVRSGESLTTALARTQAFPLRALQLLGTGEKTGDIDKMMESASRYFKDEAQSALRISAVAAGVLALLVAALMVASRVVGFWGSYGTGITGGG